MSDRQRVVVVTGGGGGIGAAIAQSVGSTGDFVVTMDPLVSVDGFEPLSQPEETTAGRIIAAGGSARSSSVSVTDEAGVRELFGQLADEFGGLDAVVNVAGITRPTGFATGSDEDWRTVLSVHLDGYRNILGAALPLMAAAGRGHILGVTSGSGWRAADAGAYGCAKRAVASLTWQLGRQVPEGVVINAISPIAATRMVTAALRRTKQTSSSGTGGLSLDSMPPPAALGPLGAHLVDGGFSACRGRVIFTAGSEVAVIDEPRLIEVVRSDDVRSVSGLIEAANPIILAPAEANQVSGGGSNSRFSSRFAEASDPNLPISVARSCAVIADRPQAAAAVSSALHAWGVTPHTVNSPDGLATLDSLDAVAVVLAGTPSATCPAGFTPGWENILAEHDDIVQRIHDDGRWARAVADVSAANRRPVRLVTVTEAATAGGRTRAQAAAQLARSASKATDARVLAFSVSVESGYTPAELVAHLMCSEAAVSLSGAELVTGAGWFGLRSHPRPIGSISFGGPALPQWFDDTLREVV